MKQVTQLDYARINRKTQFDMLPNGFLPVTANLTRTGIFTYVEMMPDGTIKVCRQLRHPDEVFAPESLETLQGLPATNNHPETQLVSPENAKDYIVGWQSDNPKKVRLPEYKDDSEDYLQSKVVFFDKEAIGQITGGQKSEISLGYTCNLDETPGEWNGQQYDAVQRDIRYNHLSLVERARGGSECRIVTDSISAHELVDGITIVRDEMKVENKTINIDANEWKALQDSKDRLQAELDEAKEKLSEVKNFDADAFKAAVAQRVALEAKASKVLDDVKLDSMSEKEIHLAVIKKLRPSANLDGKSDEYIAARFDVAIEDAKESPKPSKTEDGIGKGVIAGDAADDWTSLAAKARAKMIENSKNLYKA